MALGGFRELSSNLLTAGAAGNRKDLCHDK